jgi:hypothetical protein
MSKKKSALNQLYHYNSATLGSPKILTEQVGSVWTHQKNILEIPPWNPAWYTGYSDQGFWYTFLPRK